MAQSIASQILYGGLVGLAFTVGRTVGFAPEAPDTRQYAIDALARDGYSNIEIVGESCHIARAVDQSGHTTEAYACEAGKQRMGKGTDRPLGPDDI